MKYLCNTDSPAVGMISILKSLTTKVKQDVPCSLHLCCSTWPKFYKFCKTFMYTLSTQYKAAVILSGATTVYYRCFKNLAHKAEISQLKMFHKDKYIATWELHVKTN